MKYKQMLKIRKTERDPQVRGQDIAERTGEERRDERDRDRAPSGHGPVMGRQVAQPVPEGGHCGPADPHPPRPPAEDLRRDPEGR